MVVAADPFHITSAIAAVFSAGVLLTFKRARALARLPRESTKEAQREGRKAAILNAPIADVIESLALLGIVGSALGLLHAFSGINADALSSFESFKGAAVNVLTGVKLLAGATLAGCGLALWTTWNNRLLETATALHNEDIS